MMYNHDHRDDDFQNPYYQQNPMGYEMIPVVPKVKKQKKDSFLSRKAAALFLSLCLVVSGAMGIGGGVAAYKLSAGASQSAPGTNASDLNLQNVANKTTQGTEMSIADIAAATANSVVEITTEGVVTGNYMQQYISQGAGSGVIISEDGYIVTNNHVIEDAQKITVTLKSGESYNAVLVGTDAETDVALLRIEATGLQPAEMGDSDQLVVGQTAVAIGNPLGQLGGTVTNGIISALDREITMDNKTMTLLQTNAAINPGNSGGGLFDGQGKLIGVVVAKSTGDDVEGLGFAIPINKVKSVVEQLSSYGYVKGRVELGVSLVDIQTEQEAMMYRVNQTGVYIQQVTSGGAAATAGLQAGDCILSINGTEVSTSAEVKAILQKCEVGDTIAVQVLRSGRQGTVNVTLKESVPATEPNVQTSSQGNTQQGGNGGQNYWDSLFGF